MMVIIKINISIFIIISLLLTACGGNKEDDSKRDMEMHLQDMNETYVDTMVLHPTRFNKQIVCNGRLRAKTKSELGFLTQGIVSQVNVSEGSVVGKGDLIASLDKQEKSRDVERAEKDLERAKVELIDKLISQGYDATLEGVPEDVMKRAEVTSGYFSAQFQLQTAKRALAECDLFAPFAGRVANLEARPFQRPDKVCTLIDDSQFDVEFKILEAEFSNVRKGLHVKVSPFVDEAQKFDGVITEINPLVDDKGLIKVTARLDNHRSALIDGMNVRIVVEEEVRDMFVVPKTAVVERDGFHVVFLYKGGRAEWTYVDLVHSNINSYAITGCERKETNISDGDIVITSGNLNLADGTEVLLK